MFQTSFKLHYLRHLRPISIPLSITFLILIAIFVAGCTSENDFYTIGDNSEEIHNLLDQFERTQYSIYDAHDEDSTTIRNETILQISKYLSAAGYLDRMRIFLTTYVYKNPNDRYNPRWLLLVADSYEAPELAIKYYRRIIMNYEDIIVDGQSLHFLTLQRLIEIDTNVENLIFYYREMLENFGPYIDRVAIIYLLADVLERHGDWQEAFELYETFVNICVLRADNCRDVLPSRFNVFEITQSKLSFYYAQKDWTTEDLDTLIAQITSALARRDVGRLLQYRAGKNFFARSWEQSEFDFNSQISFNLGIFLLRSNVRFATEISENSNAHEAYLQTWGWSHRISTWYFYFRRIDFPASPEVHGNWEWQGIFFGDQF